MAILEIRKAGDPVLKDVAKPVQVVNKKIKKLISDMVETMRKADGVGLAAPQVGESLRIVVIDIGEGLLELINPEFIEKDGSVIASEGCLSVPGVFGEVERAEKVSIKALNRDGKQICIEGATGLLARAFQHEIDHLDGVLFIERAKTIQRR